MIKRWPLSLVALSLTAALVGAGCAPSIPEASSYSSQPSSQRPSTAPETASSNPADLADDWPMVEVLIPANFNNTDYDLGSIRPRPYARTLDGLFDLNDPAVELDAFGAPIQRWPGVEQPIFHPVGLSWYIVRTLESYIASGENAYLERAEVAANNLRRGGEVLDGALWFPYDFDYLLDNTIQMKPPWFAGMAQGMALSVFTRMYEVTGDISWRDAADQVFASFRVDAPADRMFLHVDDMGRLWLEEYVTPGFEPTNVINGHMYVMWGLYDYAKASGNETAIELFTAGATTMRESFEEFRVSDSTSYYCASWMCYSTDNRPTNYHRGVTWQLGDLALMTGDREFLKMAEILRSDGAAAEENGN